MDSPLFTFLEGSTETKGLISSFGLHLSYKPDPEMLGCFYTMEKRNSKINVTYWMSLKNDQFHKD